MIGGHSPNVDIAELCNCFGSVLYLDSIFEHFTNWEHQPQHLKLQHSHDVDHMVPHAYHGELCAFTCDLLKCWTEGVHAAQTALATFGLSINFFKYFQDWKSSGIDLMRPKGGKYPRISVEVDLSLAELEERMDDIESDLEYDFQSFDGKAMLKMQEPHSVWMVLEGNTPGHKKTVLHLFMDPLLNVDYNKSHDCLLHVHYFSIGGDSWDCSMLTNPYSSDQLTFPQISSILGHFMPLCFVLTRVKCVLPYSSACH